MAVYALNYTLEKGTDFETELNLTEDDGSFLNLTGYTAAAKIRKYPTLPTPEETEEWKKDLFS